MLLMAQMVKNLPARLETWVRSLGWEYPLEKGMSNPLQCSYLKNPHGQRSLAGYSPWGPKESDMTEQLITGQQNSGTSSSPNGPSSALSPPLWVDWLLNILFHPVVGLTMTSNKTKVSQVLKPALTTQFFSITDDNYYVKHLNQILIKLGGYATECRRRDDDLCCVSSWTRTNPSPFSRWTKKCKPVCRILFFHFLNSPQLHSHILRKGLRN